MVERVARAVRGVTPPGYGLYDAESEAFARAALQAMLEPTEEMIEAGVRATGNTPWDWSKLDTMKAAFNAAIQAALSEPGVK